MTNGVTASKLLISLAAIAVSLLGSAAYADSPSHSDFFSRLTLPVPKSTSMPQTQRATNVNTSPIRYWYDALDKEWVTHMATQNEEYILTRDFGSPPQLERVNEWTTTAVSLAKKYHGLASYLKSTQIPPEVNSDPKANDLLLFKKDLAEWYDDAGSFLEDYIRPRPAARTIEELNSQLKAMETRAEHQKQSVAHLLQMDSQLRDHFKVHTIDDAIWNYARKEVASQHH